MLATLLSRCRHVSGDPACSCFDEWHAAVDDARSDADDLLDDSDTVFELLLEGVPDEGNFPIDIALSELWVEFCRGETGDAVELWQQLRVESRRSEADVERVERLVLRVILTLAAHTHGAFDLRALAPLFIELLSDATFAIFD